MRSAGVASALALLGWLGGCAAQYRDVSELAEHRAMVGQVCEVAQPLRAHGVVSGSGTARQLDHISIWNPGFTGPELGFVVMLQPGTRIEIQGARVCSNCLGDPSLAYRVQVRPEPPEFAGKPAFLRATATKQPELRCPLPRS
jgi:hypothetical protein